MHIILGAGGPIANALTAELLQHGQHVRLASRRSPAQAPDVPWIQTDLKNKDEVLAAVKGATVIYMTAGLTYDRKVWAAEWPLIAQHLIAAAKETGAHLVFFDNVYMYGPVAGPMTEETPYQPTAVKGEIRARVASALQEEAQRGAIRLSIARSADFYGTGSSNSVLDALVLARLAKGQKAMWIGDPRTRHSFTYVPDAAHALFLLGGQPAKGSNNLWHLPTAPPLTGLELMQLAAETYSVPLRYTTVGKTALRLIGFFNKPAGESVELFYQNDRDYLFDSSRFEQAFGVSPTPYREGIAAVGELFRVKSA